MTFVALTQGQPAFHRQLTLAGWRLAGLSKDLPSFDERLMTGTA